MRLTFVGDSPLVQRFSYPGGTLEQGQSITVTAVPEFVNANPGAWLLDGKPYTKPKPKPAAKPETKPAPKEKHG